MRIENLIFLAFLQFLLLCEAERIPVTEIIEIVNYLITYSFQDKVHCVYLISDSNTELFILMNILIKTSIPVVSVELVNTNYCNLNKQCNGYVVITKNSDFLTYIFEETTDSCLFKPHERILIFYDGKEDLRHLPLEQAAVIRGMDIMTIEGLIVNTLPTIKTLKNVNKLESIKVKITSLRNNRTWAVCNSPNNIKCNKDFFKMSAWVPKFQYRSKAYQLNITAFEYRPYVLCDTNNKVRDGIEYRVLKDLIKDWPVQFIIITEGLPGLDLWETTVHHVAKKSGTIALGAHWLFHSERYDVDKSVPYGQSCVAFLVPKPKIMNPALFVFQPLNITLWLVMVVTTCVIILILHAVAITYKKIRVIKHPYLDISLTILDVVSLCTTRTALYLCDSLSGLHLKIIFLVLSVHSLLFAAAYLTGYASLLTYPRYSEPIRTFEDLVTNKVHWESKDTSYNFLLRNSTFVTFNQLADLQDLNQSMETLNYRIQENNIAFAVETVDYGYIMETETFDDYAKSNLKRLSGCIFNTHIIMYINKDSPYTKLINRHINRIFENGLLPHWDLEMRYQLGERYLSNFYSEFVTEVLPRDPLSLNDMQGAFYLLFIGYLLSTIIFVLEYKHN